MKKIICVTSLVGIIYIYKIRNINIYNNKINDIINDDKILQEIISKINLQGSKQFFMQIYVPKKPYLLDDIQLLCLYNKKIYVGFRGEKQIITYDPTMKLNKNLKAKL
jgi:hypothetical protein